VRLFPFDGAPQKALIIAVMRKLRRRQDLETLNNNAINYRDDCHRWRLRHGKNYDEDVWIRANKASGKRETPNAASDGERRFNPTSVASTTPM
jgi:hypothetical protein